MSMRQPERIAIAISNDAKNIAFESCGIPPLRKERAKMGHPAVGTGSTETPSSFARRDGRMRPSPHENFRRCAMLAGHLRERARVQGFEELARFRGVVFLVGREHDQEETIF